MALSADAAGKLGKKFIVLDRPDPIRGDRVDGNVLEPRFRSFVGQYPAALRYGLTAGELLRYLVGSGQVAADIAVVPMRGWRRAMWWDETGIPWVNPSPNLRTLAATLLYPGTVFFEGTNATEGRGTDKPFQLIGAAWLADAGAIAREMNALALPGVRFDSTSRTIEPSGGFKFGGQTIPSSRCRRAFTARYLRPPSRRVAMASIDRSSRGHRRASSGGGARNDRRPPREVGSRGERLAGSNSEVLDLLEDARC